MSRTGSVERGQGGLRVGPQHDRIAGEQRRDRVADRQGERVVPRGHDADDPDRVVAGDGVGEHRQDPCRAAWGKVCRGAAGVVARHEGDVGDLLETVRPGLAGLELDQVEQLVLVGEHQVVQAQHDPLAVCQRRSRPRPLGGSGRRDGDRHILRSGLRDLGDDLARHRGDRGPGGSPGDGDDPPGEPGPQRRVDGIPAGAAVRGGHRGRVSRGRWAPATTSTRWNPLTSE